MRSDESAPMLTIVRKIFIIYTYGENGAETRDLPQDSPKYIKKKRGKIMFALFIFGIVCAVVGVAAILVTKKSNSKKKAPFIAVAVALLLAGGASIAGSCVRTVPTGHTGIVTTFGNVESYTYEAGVHFTVPWKTVINMDNRNQKAAIDLLSFSSDIQEVAVTYTLNYQIKKENAQDIYRTIGISYFDTVITPRIQEAVKSVVAKYTAEQLLEMRADLSNEIKNILVEKLATYNIEVVDTSLENLDFSDAFTTAVEAKQVAAQKSQQAKIEQEQALMEAEYAKNISETKANADAAVAKIAAQAELDVTKIQADAAEYAGQKDAAIIGQVRDIFAQDPENLTNEDIEALLLYYYIQKWNGTLPETYFGAENFSELLSSLAGKNN